MLENTPLHQLWLRQVRQHGIAAIVGKNNAQLRKWFFDSPTVAWIEANSQALNLNPSRQQDLDLLTDLWMLERASDQDVRLRIAPIIRTEHPGTLGQLDDDQLIALWRELASPQRLYTAFAREIKRTPAKPNAFTNTPLVPDTMRAILKAHYGDNTIETLERHGKLSLLASVDELPLSIRTSQAEFLPYISGITTENRDVYLVANRVAPEQAAGLFLHEVGEHAGLSDMLGDDYARLCKQFQRLLRKGDSYATWAAMRVPASTRSKNVPSEQLAYLVERVANDAQARPGGDEGYELGQDCLSKLRTWLFRTPLMRWLDDIDGLEDFTLNPADIASLAREAVNHVARQYDESITSDVDNQWLSQLDAATLDALFSADQQGREDLLASATPDQLAGYLYALSVTNAAGAHQTIERFSAILNDMAVGKHGQHLSMIAGDVLAQARSLETRAAADQQIKHNGLSLWMDDVSLGDNAALHLLAPSGKGRDNWHISHYRQGVGLFHQDHYPSAELALQAITSSCFVVPEGEAAQVLARWSRQHTEAEPQTHSKAFQQWFQHSATVNEAGEPMVLYHGTNQDISVFDKGFAFWASSNPAQANKYAEFRGHYEGGQAVVMPVYMQAQRPFDADRLPSKSTSISSFFNAVAQQAKLHRHEFDVAQARLALNHLKGCASRVGSGPYYRPEDFWHQPEQLFGQDGAATIKHLMGSLGFDSIRFTEDGTLTFGVFSSEQIKSASGNVGTFLANVRDTRFSFGGAIATTSHHDLLRQAQLMHQQGEDASAILESTGWSQGADNQWRFEIDDSDATLVEDGWYGNGELEGYAVQTMIGHMGDMTVELNEHAAAQLGYSHRVAPGILQHPKLLAAYPQLASINVQIHRSEGFATATSGSYEPHRNLITINVNPALGGDPLSVLLHELQHAVQRIEGFARGGNVEMFEGDIEQQLRDQLIEIVTLDALAQANNVTPGYFAEHSDYAPDFVERVAQWEASAQWASVVKMANERLLDPSERYRRLAGEVEARNVQARQNLTESERRSTLPMATADVEPQAVIVWGNNLETSADALVPANNAVADTPVNSAAFKRWFGDSVLRDSSGEPLVLYTGTRASFNEFDPLRMGGNTDAGWYSAGFYATPDPAKANEYAQGTGGNVMPLYARLERPYYWRNYLERGLFQNSAGASLQKTAELIEAGHDGVIVANDFYQLGHDELLQDNQWELLTQASPLLGNMGREKVSALLREKEYPYRALKDSYGQAFVDSLTPSRTEIIEVVLFTANQMKSAIGNNGDFDPDTADIRFSFAGTSAVTADIMALDEAKRLLDAGRSSSVIQRETGWHMGFDGLWRFEISDNEAAFRNGRFNAEKTIEQIRPLVRFEPDSTMIRAIYPDPANGDLAHWGRSEDEALRNLARYVHVSTHGTDFDLETVKNQIYPLGQVLHHPGLFAAYPSLQHLSVHFPSNMDADHRGSYIHADRLIELNANLKNNEAELLSTLLHEIQHAIQGIENFARGGMADSDSSTSIKESLAAMTQDLQRQSVSWQIEHQALIDDADKRAEVARDALIYESMERLYTYAVHDTPSSLFRLIRNEMQWLYDPEFRGNETANELTRRFYEIPKRGVKRNEFIRQMAHDSAVLLRQTIPAAHLAMFREDPRTVRGMVKAMSRESSKAAKRLHPLRDIDAKLRQSELLLERSKYKGPYSIYRALAGEVEARATQARIKMTSQERRESPVQASIDVEPAEVIVIFHGREVRLPATQFSRSASTTAEMESDDGFAVTPLVDAEGNPVIAYHGTDAEFTVFQPSERGTFGPGIYLSDSDEDSARAYGENVMPLYVFMQNPWRIDVEHDSEGAFAEDFDHPGVEAILSLPNGRQMLDAAKNADFGHFGQELQDALTDLGYDGVIATYPDSSKEFVVFKPEQVKSATQNNGNFSPNNPDIRFALAGEQATGAPLAALAYAKQMHQMGKHADDIWHETGWALGMDERWRFEIDDSKALLNDARLKSLHDAVTGSTFIQSVTYHRHPDGSFDLVLTPPSPRSPSDLVSLYAISEQRLETLLPGDLAQAIQRGDGEESIMGRASNLLDARQLPAAFSFDGLASLPLSEVLEHPALYAAYPQLRNMPVSVTDKQEIGGYLSWVDGQWRVTLGRNAGLETLIHELQHAVQEIEGFAKGGSVKLMRDVIYPELVAKVERQAQRLDRDYAERSDVVSVLVKRISDADKATLLSNPVVAQALQELYEGQADDDFWRDMLTNLEEYASSEDMGSIGNAWYSEITHINHEIRDRTRILNGSKAELDRLLYLGSHGSYHRLPGEIEARNASIRLQFTEQHRRQVRPELTQDVPVAEAFLSWRGIDTAVLREDGPVADEHQQDNFSRWFGDSKVVDSEGMPLVVYHGTTADLTAFIPQLGHATAQGVSFFTASPELASDYALNGQDREVARTTRAYTDFLSDPDSDIFSSEAARLEAEQKQALEVRGDGQIPTGANVVPVYLSLQNPLVVVAKSMTYPEQRDLFDKAAAAGHDGVIIKGTRDGASSTTKGITTDVFAVFKDTQIKSAIGNNGGFDPSNLDIRFSLVDGVAESELTRLREDAPEDDANQQDNFSRWFGDSEVVDEAGMPLMVYHGTTADFDAFELPGRKTGKMTGGKAIFFAADPKTSNDFARYEGARTLPVYLSAQNLFDFRNEAHMAKFEVFLRRNFDAVAPGALYGPDAAIAFVKSGDYGLLEQPAVITWMKRNRFDGMRLIERQDQETFAVFRPEQIKFAIGNIGKFNPSNADTRFSLAAGVAEGALTLTADSIGYQADLFGDPLPGASARRTGSVARKKTAPAPAFQDTRAPEGEYFVRTIVGTDTKRTLNADLIQTPFDLAQATQYLNKSAVERFDGIVTDKNGKPLAVVGGFKGAVDSATIPAEVLIAEAVRVNGGANIWFSHNHPSGNPELSRADRQLFATLAELFDGTGIKARGLIAVGDDSFHATDETTGAIPKPGLSVVVTAIEREQVKLAENTPSITSPAAALSVAKLFQEKHAGPGLLLLNTQNHVNAWITLTDPMRGQLMHTGQLHAIYRAVSESNSSGVVLVHGGELDQTLPESYDRPVSMNIVNALKRLGLNVLDIINVKTGSSAAENGHPFSTDRILFSFAGSRAGTASMEALADARLRHEQGIDPEVIRQQTGWFMGHDEKWRFEIDDSEARALPSSQLSAGQAVALDQVIDHPLLFAAYPELRTITVTLSQYSLRNLSLGSYDPDERHIHVAGDTQQDSLNDEQVSVLLHEIQHALQVHEGFAVGGSASDESLPSAEQFLQEVNKRFAERVNTVRVSAEYNAFIAERLQAFPAAERYKQGRNGLYDYGRDQVENEAYDHFIAPIDDERLAKIDQMLAEFGVFEGVDTKRLSYNRLGGEVEARNVQTRLAFSAAERQAQSPAATEDVQASEVIIRFEDAPEAAEGLQEPVVETPAFKAWFDQSKVVQEDGAPLMVYHGTTVRDSERAPGMGDIGAFDRLFTTQFRSPSIDTIGSWFSSSPSESGAQLYSGQGEGSVIYPVYLSIQNPQETTFQLMLRRARLLANGVDDGRMVGEAEVNAYRQWLKEMGKDGIKIVHDDYADNGSTEFAQQTAWIALEPEQIKSAVGNTGAFDKANPDIRFSLGSPLHPSPQATAAEPAVGALVTWNGEQIQQINLPAQTVRTTDTPEFRRWFGSSQIVDLLGEPLKAYHGTGADFTEFSTGVAYFTPRHDYSYIRNSSTVMPVYLSIQNPYRPTDKAEIEQVRSNPERVEELRAQGYDGMLWSKRGDLMRGASGWGDDLPQIVTFDPAQVKSAIGNNGDFSASTPDIRFSLTEQQPLSPVERPAFRQWFRDSQVTDASGKPLVVYYGTGDDFSVFQTSRIGTGADHNKESTNAFWFTDEPVVANQFAALTESPAVMPMYLSIRNPLEVDARQWAERVDTLDDAFRFDDGTLAYNINAFKHYVLSVARQNGNDGVIFRGGYDGTPVKGATIYATVDPSQMKSAVGNIGNFNRLHNDIRFSLADTQDAPSFSEAFKAWFGPSQAVSPEGLPLVMYGVGATEAGEFQPRTGLAGNAFYFCANPGHAIQSHKLTASGEQSGISPVFLNIQNPIIFESINDLPARPIDTERLAALGYDGIIIRADANGKTDRGFYQAAVFDQAQIKSAMSYIGTLHALSDAEYQLTDSPIEIAKAQEEAETQSATSRKLDMSREARLTRARAMGFDTSKPWYHGTNASGFRAFNTQGKGDTKGTGAFFAANWDMARTYTKSADDAPLRDGQSLFNDPDQIESLEIEAFWVILNGNGRVVEEASQRSYDSPEHWLEDEGFELEQGERVEAAFSIYYDGDLTFEYGTKEEAIEHLGEYEFTAPGIYSVYLRTEDTLVLDWEGRSWSDGPQEATVWSVRDEDGITMEDFFDEAEALELQAQSPGSTIEIYEYAPYANTNDAARQARDMGFDSVLIRNVYDNGPHRDANSGDIMVVFDAKNIRSVDAAFDPQFSTSDNLLYRLETAPHSVEFDQWFAGSHAVNERGEPILLYRGEHGQRDAEQAAVFQSRLGSLSFGDFDTALTYATQPNVRGDYPHEPRVTPAYVSIKQPLVNSSDPFIDMPILIQALGTEKATRIAIELAEWVEDTQAWYDLETDLSVEDYLAQHPQALASLYVMAFPVFDNPLYVQWMQQAGFDGGIHGGWGANSEGLEYRVFSPEQVIAGAAMPAMRNMTQAQVSIDMTGVRLSAAAGPFQGAPATGDQFTTAPVEPASQYGAGQYVSERALAHEAARYGLLTQNSYKGAALTMASIKRLLDNPETPAPLSSFFNAAKRSLLAGSDIEVALRDHMRKLQNKMATLDGDLAAVLRGEERLLSAQGYNLQLRAVKAELGWLIGHMQDFKQVALAKPDTDSFLDWHAPITGQPAAVREALALIGFDGYYEVTSAQTRETFLSRSEAQLQVRRLVDGGVKASLVEHFPHEHPITTGQGLYESLSALIGGEAEASRLLESCGIAGVKYDQTTARSGYVLFAQPVTAPRTSSPEWATIEQQGERKGREGEFQTLRDLPGVVLRGPIEQARQPLVATARKAVSAIRERITSLEQRSSWLSDLPNVSSDLFERNKAALTAAREDLTRHLAWQAPSTHNCLPWSTSVPEGLIKRIQQVIAIKPEDKLSGQAIFHLIADRVGSTAKACKALSAVGIIGAWSDAQSLLWDQSSQRLATSIQSASAESARFHLAYHGTPHSLTHFSNKMIGSGEGVQAYGWGLYFAERLSVASFYQQMRNRDNCWYGRERFDHPVDLADAIVPGLIEKHPHLTHDTDSRRDLETALRHLINIKCFSTGYLPDILHRYPAEIMDVIKPVLDTILPIQQNQITGFFIMPRDGVQALNEIEGQASPDMRMGLHEIQAGLNWALNINMSDAELQQAFDEHVRDVTNAERFLKARDDVAAQLAKRPDSEYAQARLRDLEHCIHMANCAKAAVEQFGPFEVQRPIGGGNLYMTDIDIKDSEYLDHDKPFSAQSSVVQRAFKLITKSSHLSAEAIRDLQQCIELDKPGSELYACLVEGDVDSAEQRASMLLLDYAVQGIRYLDGLCRNRDSQIANNFVVFDDAKIKIVGHTDKVVASESSEILWKPHATEQRATPQSGLGV